MQGSFFKLCVKVTAQFLSLWPSVNFLITLIGMAIQIRIFLDKTYLELKMWQT